MLRLFTQVVGGLVSGAFAVGGLGAIVLQVTGLPRRASAGLIYGGPAVVMGLALLAFAAFVYFSLCLPRRHQYLRHDGQLYSLVAFGGLMIVAVIWGGVQRAV
jgi:hypothetical protein